MFADKQANKSAQQTDKASKRSADDTSSSAPPAKRAAPGAADPAASDNCSPVELSKLTKELLRLAANLPCTEKITAPMWKAALVLEYTSAELRFHSKTFHSLEYTGIQATVANLDKKCAEMPAADAKAQMLSVLSFVSRAQPLANRLQGSDVVS